MISVIVSLKSKSDHRILEKNLETLDRFPQVQVLPVVHHHADRSLTDLISRYALTPLISKSSSRAARMNDGIERARHSLVLLLHPRSQIEASAIDWLIQNHDQLVWGGFHHRFDHNHPLLQFTSWYSNHIRGKRRGIIYLDHCLFFHRNLLQDQRPVPEQDIFEDTLLSLRLQQVRQPVMAPHFSTTSAVRFQTNGYVKQSLLNQVMKLGFHCGLSDKRLNRIYEWGLNLN